MSTQIVSYVVMPEIADVNMPPGEGDDGLRAAIELRQQRPETGVLVFSQYYEE